MLRVEIGFLFLKVAGLLNCTSNFSCSGAIAAKVGLSKTVILNFFLRAIGQKIQVLDK